MFKNSFKYWLFLFSLILVAISVVISDKSGQNGPIEQQKKIQELFLENVSRAEGILRDHADLSGIHPKDQKEFYRRYGLIFLNYKGDSLNFWSNNSIPFEKIPLHKLLARKTLDISGTIVFPVSLNKNQGPKIILLILKKNYPIRNDFLETAFHPFYQTNENLTIAKEGLPIKTPEGETAFFIGNELVQASMDLTILIVGLFGILLFFLSIIFFFESIANWLSRPISLLLVTTLIGIIRYLSFAFKIPGSLYQSIIFSPEVFANAVVSPSLGDFLLNSFCLFLVVLLFSTKYKTIFSDRFQIPKWVPWLTVPGISIGLGMLLSEFAVNSKIAFTLDNFLFLDYYSLAGLLIISLLLGTYFLLIDLLLNGRNTKTDFYLMLGAYSVWGLLFYPGNPKDLIFICWSLPVSLIYFIKKSAIASRTAATGILCIYAAFTAYILYEGNYQREIAGVKILSNKLSSEQDPIAEYLLTSKIELIKKDSLLKKYSSDFWVNKEVTEKHIRDNFFSGYWEKYDIITTVCNYSDFLFIEETRLEVGCLNFFDSLIVKGNKTIIQDTVYFLDNNSGRITYLLQIKNFPSPGKNLFIELHSRLLNEGIGYPELLLNKSSASYNGLPITDYSYARYNKGVLINRAGDFAYPGSDKLFLKQLNKGESFEMEEYTHFVFQPEKTEILVLSRRSRGIVSGLSYFSYLFLFFIIIISIGFIILSIRKNGFRFQVNFKQRIQLAIISSLIITLAITGTGAVYYQATQYKKKNNNNLREKIYSILIELDQKFSKEKSLGPDNIDYSNYQLTKLSGIFFSDINLFDDKGKLIGSSRMEIFEKGLLSGLMNSDAYRQMVDEQRSIFIHEEELGNIKFLSAYMPLNNFENKVIGYINLPYFSRQTDLQNEISSFLVTLINLYVFLIGFSLVVAVFVSNRVAAPLAMIREKLARINLSAANEKIEWKTEDEIGALVEVYNSKVRELDKSIRELAISQRESAWREMARQVAHEIRNPLTPMKLSIQHLQRSFDPGKPDSREKIKKFTDALLGQIDLLNKITEEFHSFARMPEAFNKPLDLAGIISTSVELFENYENLEIEFINQIPTPAIIVGDQDHLMRMFNNLIRNSIQAIPRERTGRIVIKLSKLMDAYGIEISDNGTGIADEAIQTLFMPNFTTKTKGMGLGLAIVKRIIENSGGSISFETEKDKGTIFKIILPEAN